MAALVVFRYAKAKCHPTLDMEAAELIVERYGQLRSKETEYKSLPVTARTLECMIRLSTAHAKSRLSDTVDKDDAKAALDLINFSYFNNAKPKDKEDDRMAVSDEESEDDDDDEAPGDSSRGSQRSATSSPTKGKRSDAAKTPKKSPLTPGKGKGKGKARAASDDPFAFDDEVDSSSKKKSTPKASGAAARSARTARRLAEPAAAAAAPKPAVEFSAAQHHLVRDTLAALFTGGRRDVIESATLVAELEKVESGIASDVLEAVLLEMESDNDVMVSGNKIFKI